VTRPERFTVVTPLPPHGDWRRALALDAAAHPPRVVVLSFVPPAVLEDPARLAAVVRDVEAAGRLHHPGAVRVMGLETVGEAPAVAEEHVRGVSARALLDTGGRLPPGVAARIVVDACAAVARAHALDAGDGRGLVHGGLAPSRLVVGDDGATRVCGFGAGGGGLPADDVRALIAVLYECLAGEPAGETPQPLGPGIPAALAAAVDAATGAAPGGRPESAVALAQLVAAAGPVAPHGDVAAYAEVILPPGDPARAAGERALAATRREEPEEVSAELLAPMGAVEPTPVALPRPPATRPGVDPAGVFAAPAPPPRRSGAPLAVALVCLVAGFGVGLWAARERASGPASPSTGVLPSDAAAPRAPSAPPPVAREPAPPPSPPVEPPRPAPAPGRRAAAAPTPPPPVEPPRTAPAPRPPPAARPKKAQQPATRAADRPAASQAVARGWLDVTAPAGAEVFLDGKRIGVGGLRLEIPAGAHEIEVRLGEASVSQTFEMEPNGSWTYEVTPTPPR
jgi:hypothetical protein